jgi:hypothetical protein
VAPPPFVSRQPARVTPDERLTLMACAGVWTTAMARGGGFSIDQIRGRREAKEWRVLRSRGIYAHAGVEPSAIMRAAAAVLAAGGGVQPSHDADRAHADPANADPAHADRAHADRAHADRAHADPANADPAHADRAHADRAQADPADAAGRTLELAGSAAAEAAIPPAAAAGRTAARVWEIPLVDDDDPATQRFESEHDDVIVRRGRSMHRTLHTRETALTPNDIVYVHGVPVLSPLRTLADLAVVLRPDALVAAIDFALHEERVQLVELEAVAAVRRRGCVALRTALALADAKAESPHESLTRLVLKPVLPGLDSQVRVFDRRGFIIARLDLGDEELRLGVESDGAAYHRGRAAEDRRRDSRTGWTIERCSWFETRREAEQLRRRVLATADSLRAKAA